MIHDTSRESIMHFRGDHFVQANRKRQRIWLKQMWFHYYCYFIIIIIDRLKLRRKPHNDQMRSSSAHQSRAAIFHHCFSQLNSSDWSLFESWFNQRDDLGQFYNRHKHVWGVDVESKRNIHSGITSLYFERQQSVFISLPWERIKPELFENVELCSSFKSLQLICRNQLTLTPPRAPLIPTAATEEVGLSDNADCHTFIVAVEGSACEEPRSLKHFSEFENADADFHPNDGLRWWSGIASLSWYKCAQHYCQMNAIITITILITWREIFEYRTVSCFRI